MDGFLPGNSGFEAATAEVDTRDVAMLLIDDLISTSGISGVQAPGISRPIVLDIRIACIRNFAMGKR